MPKNKKGKKEHKHPEEHPHVTRRKEQEAKRFEKNRARSLKRLIKGRKQRQEDAEAAGNPVLPESSYEATGYENEVETDIEPHSACNEPGPSHLVHENPIQKHSREASKTGITRKFETFVTQTSKNIMYEDPKNIDELTDKIQKQVDATKFRVKGRVGLCLSNEAVPPESFKLETSNSGYEIKMDPKQQSSDNAPGTSDTPGQKVNKKKEKKGKGRKKDENQASPLQEKSPVEPLPSWTGNMKVKTDCIETSNDSKSNRPTSEMGKKNQKEKKGKMLAEGAEAAKNPTISSQIEKSASHISKNIIHENTKKIEDSTQAFEKMLDTNDADVQGNGENPKEESKNTIIGDIQVFPTDNLENVENPLVSCYSPEQRWFRARDEHVIISIKVEEGMRIVYNSRRRSENNLDKDTQTCSDTLEDGAKTAIPDKDTAFGNKKRDKKSSDDESDSGGFDEYSGRDDEAVEGKDESLPDAISGAVDGLIEDFEDRLIKTCDGVIENFNSLFEDIKATIKKLIEDIIAKYYKYILEKC